MDLLPGLGVAWPPAAAGLGARPDVAGRRADRGLVAFALIVIGAYAVLGRAFAQIGVASANLFIGELLIFAMVLAAPTRAAIGAAIAGLARPGPLHTLWWGLAVFVTYGLFEFGRGLGAEPAAIVDAGKNLVFNYLPVFLLGGIAVAALDGRAMATLARWLPWANAAFILIFRVALKHRVISLPGSQMRGVTYGLACFVSLALMLCYDRPVGRRWYLYAITAFCLLYLQVRAWWVAAVVGLAVWGLLRRRARHLAAVGGLVLAVLIAMAAADVRVPGPPDRGGEVSIQSLFGRAVAPFDAELAARLTPNAASYQGTTQWRETWWKRIWAGVHEREDRALVGYGYGFPLSDLVPYIPDAIRTPHNVFMYALGYGGWLGVGVFALFQALLARALWLVYRATTNPVGILIWVMGLVAGNFENFFETPYMAVPYYFLLGVALQPLATDLSAAARRAHPERRVPPSWPMPRPSPAPGGSASSRSEGSRGNATGPRHGPNGAVQ